MPVDPAPENSGSPESIYEDAPIEQASPKENQTPSRDSTKAPRTLLDTVLDEAPTADASQNFGTLKQFLDESNELKALSTWFGTLEGLDKPELLLRINRDVAYIDGLLNDQVNAILHHPKFQKLESSWRGLQFLVNSVSSTGASDIKVRVLHFPWKEVTRDIERAVEFDQSQLFRKVYEGEFGTPGGEPFGMMIGDYEIQPRPSDDHPYDDIATLSSISEICAASFCPFITSVAPSMFGINEFQGLQHVEDLARGFEGAEFIKWRAFRQQDSSRFVGLTLPRVLMRRPYDDDGTRKDTFCFEEDVAARNRSKYIWGNAAYAYGEVVTRAYAQCGWLAEIRGVERDLEWGGLVTGLPVHHFGTDRMGVAPKCSTEVMFTDNQENQLTDLGFLPLSHCWDTEYSAFYGSASAQRPQKYETLEATQNAKISSMLQYMFCVSRFAHYLKVITRDKIGSSQEPEDCERVLDRWIKNYVSPDDNAKPEIKARMPLREANVAIKRDPSQPGKYLCTLHLQPHYQLDDLTASLRIRTTVEPQGE